jgi:hypothetical protein
MSHDETTIPHVPIAKLILLSCAHTHRPVSVCAQALGPKTQLVTYWVVVNNIQDVISILKKYIKGRFSKIL